MHNSLAIKNLSISLEALSRINGASNLSYEVENLLQREIEKAKEEKPKPESKFEQETRPDDDIPF